MPVDYQMLITAHKSNPALALGLTHLLARARTDTAAQALLDRFVELEDIAAQLNRQCWDAGQRIAELLDMIRAREGV